MRDDPGSDSGRPYSCGCWRIGPHLRYVRDSTFSWRAPWRESPTGPYSASAGAAAFYSRGSSKKRKGGLLGFGRLSLMRTDEILKLVIGPAVLDVGCAGHEVKLGEPDWLHGRL